MSHVDVLLSRLQKVKPNGPDRWLACCPAHTDKSPSLSVRVADEGRILVHCFAGCGAADVVSAVGLELTDLFDKPLAPHLAKLRRRDLGVSPIDVMYAMRREALVLSFIASDFSARGPDKELCERAQLAAQRLHFALSLCDG